ncbi:MAG: aminodeoxychorismate synthase component I [Gammaproteobacteria bacterium]|nr:MAG: aminodeoxychorismate synthase component I [Gammaproteobacteria bacterium]
MLVRRPADNMDLLALHELDPVRYPCLLESVAHGSPQSRYDILFAFPGERIIAPDDKRDFLNRFNRSWRNSRDADSATNNSELPFRGGWLVYLGYELAAEIEPTLDLPANHGQLPVACAIRIPAAVILDHAHQELLLVVESGVQQLIAIMEDDLDRALNVTDGKKVSPVHVVMQPDDPARFLNAVKRTKAYIRDGDIFQANLSRLWRGKLPESISDVDIYQQLRDSNPAPFACLARLPGGSILSSSPERLVSTHAGIIQTRPIAGTRPRDTSRQALLADTKERAEHIMLIDLERNDLGRVCVPGSIEVDELMGLETYEHVHHIVSNVTGRLAKGIGPADIIRAVFPGGTITGCPKVRAMEIIAELEGKARGAYTGSIGYVNNDGDMDFNILIRTIVREGDTISVRAGAGIVADSLPARELDETCHKARGMLHALGSSA